jgi:beta-lactamase class A
MRSTIVFLALILVGCGSPTPASAPPKEKDDSLQRELAEIAGASDGTVAVTVVQLSTGERAAVHGDARLPMMSVFKLPLAIAALARVDAGEWKLDQSVEIAEKELRPGVSSMADAWKTGQHTFTLESMLKRVIQESDNTAGDKLVAMLGAPKVTAFLRAHEVPGVDVAEQEIEIDARTHCAGVAAPAEGWTFAAIDACKVDPAVKLAAMRHEIAASPNGATTDALANLLVRLDRGALLSPASTRWLLDVMAGTTTGKARIQAGVPKGTRIEHKTGTGESFGDLNMATNDVGIVTLPNGQRFALSILTAGSTRDAATREATIAKLTAACWKHFVR